MKTLVIAPKSNIDAIAEIIAASGLGETQTLYGMVAGREVISTVANGNFGILVFVLDSNTKFLEMSDGLLNTDELENAIQHSGTIYLVVLSSCEGLGTAAEIYLGGVSYAIGWQRQVGDKVASEFTSTFLRAYRLNRNIHDSYDLAVSALRKFYPTEDAPILLNGRDRGYQSQIEDMATQIIRQQRWIFILGLAVAASLLLELITIFYMMSGQV